MHRLCKDCSDVSNNICFLELVDKELFHRSNKHNNRLLLVVILFYNSHIRKRIDRTPLAFPLFFYARSLGKLFYIYLNFHFLVRFLLYNFRDRTRESYYVIC